VNEEQAMAKLVLPRVQAMVLCDDVEESDLESGTFHLKGVRSEIRVPSFPYIRRQLCVFLQMSGHAGEASCHVEINRPETDEALYRYPSFVVSFQGPVSVVPVFFQVLNCSFPAPGVYYIQFFHESKLIGERPLHLVPGEMSHGERTS
jgi:hypothetical protein